MVETRGRKRKNDDQEIKEKLAKRKGNAKRKAKKTRKTTMEETMAEETTAVEETTGEETTAVETTSDVAEAPVEANEVDEEDTEDKEDGDEENEVDDGEENSDGGDEDNEIEDGDGEEKSDGDEENEDNDGEEKSDGSDEDNDGEGKSDGSDEEEEGEESEEEVGAIGEENANEENGNEEIANPNEEIHNNEDIGNIANEQGGRPAEEVTDETEAIKPTRMFFKPSEYNKKIKLSTRCFIVDAVTTLKNLKPKLSNAEWNWFVEHPQFRHIFHMKRENHRVQGMWMLLLRTTCSCKMREVWFVVNGTPIRYGLREHALISGLNCHNYPLGYKELGGTKFMDRHFKEGEPRRLEDVKAKLLNMGPHRDRLKMAVLFFLASVICGQTKVGNGANDVLEFFQRAVDDLELCRTFPWGRFSFDYMLKEIAHTMAHFGGLVKENALWPLPGFCVPLELLAFEAIPSMGKQFRQPVEGVDVYCPRMCRSSFKRNEMTGISLSEINKALGEETDIHSIIPTITPQENTLLDDIMEDEDDVDLVDLAVDSWDKRIDEGLPIFFKDMYDEDVAAREKQKDDASADGGGQISEQSNQEGGVIKLLKRIFTMVKKVEKKIDNLDGRLVPLEAFVKGCEFSGEIEKQKKRKK